MPADASKAGPAPAEIDSAIALVRRQSELAGTAERISAAQGAKRGPDAQGCHTGPPGICLSFTRGD